MSGIETAGGGMYKKLFDIFKEPKLKRRKRREACEFEQMVSVRKTELSKYANFLALRDFARCLTPDTKEQINLLSRVIIEINEDSKP